MCQEYPALSCLKINVPQVPGRGLVILSSKANKLWEAGKYFFILQEWSFWNFFPPVLLQLMFKNQTKNIPFHHAQNEREVVRTAASPERSSLLRTLGRTAVEKLNWAGDSVDLVVCEKPLCQTQLANRGASEALAGWLVGKACSRCGWRRYWPPLLLAAEEAK